MSASNSQDKTRDALVLPVAIVVLLGWMVSLGFAVLTNQYAPLTAVTPVMLILAGYVFGSNIIRSATKDRGGDD